MARGYTAGEGGVRSSGEFLETQKALKSAGFNSVDAVERISDRYGDSYAVQGDFIRENGKIRVVASNKINGLSMAETQSLFVERSSQFDAFVYGVVEKLKAKSAEYQKNADKQAENYERELGSNKYASKEERDSAARSFRDKAIAIATVARAYESVANGIEGELTSKDSKSSGKTVLTIPNFLKPEFEDYAANKEPDVSRRGRSDLRMWVKNPTSKEIKDWLT
jgi:hypothetical protein